MVVAVDVGKNCVALSVTDAGRHRLFGPVEFAMTRPALERVVDRIGAVLLDCGTATDRRGPTRPGCGRAGSTAGSSPVRVQRSPTELTGDATCVDFFDRALRVPIGRAGGLDVELAPYGARWSNSQGREHRTGLISPEVLTRGWP